HERPHEAHGGQPPSSVWVPSLRIWDGKVPDVEYPESSALCLVSPKGAIKIGGGLFLSEALQGEYVRVLEVDDGLDAILFDRMILAYYDRVEQSIIRIDPT
ncbi:transposase, partial [Pantoea sp. B65]